LPLTAKQTRYILVGAALLLVAVVILSILWEALKTIVGVAIGLFFLYLGVRLILGKGLPGSVSKVVKKAAGSIGGGEGEDKPKEE